MPKASKSRSTSSGGGGGGGGAPYTKTNNVFKMNTDLGQHILKNPGVAQAIVDKAGLKQSDVVLEVGPGTGNLTVKILEKARRVIAVEMDPRMAAELTKRVQGKPEQARLEVMLGDVVKTELPWFDVCISNTPYQISSPLVFKLLALTPPPRTCILMFQREFALRLTARPGDALYCRLSVNAQMWAKCTHIMKVGKNNFKPPPQVESSVVKIEPKVPRPGVDYEEWDGLLRVLFGRRNRTVSASFASAAVMSVVERNYRVWCAASGAMLDDDDDDNDNDGGGDGEEMDIDDDDDEGTGMKPEQQQPAVVKTSRKGKNKSKTGLLVKSKVRKVLEETELGGKRAGKCDEADFLRLLLAFNGEGIHFS